MNEPASISRERNEPASISPDSPRETGKRVFRASRWTAGNRLFPTAIEITGDAVVLRKRSWFSTSEKTIHLAHVASVGIEAGMLFDDVRIESSGGGEDIVSHGHWKGDARRIRDLVQEWATRHLPSPDDPQARTRA